MKQIFFLRVVVISFVLIFLGVFNSQATKSDAALEEMDIKGLTFDTRAQSPIVILTDKKQNIILPIWIGICEARSIELGLSDVVAPRPLTYDLIAAVIRTLNAEVKRVVIVDLRDEVFYAQVEVSVNGEVSKIDARPSDAIALASRMNSPIFVKKTVLKKAALLDPDQEKRRL